jgi:hypothetical protein
MKMMNCDYFIPFSKWKVVIEADMSKTGDKTFKISLERGSKIAFQKTPR